MSPSKAADEIEKLILAANDELLTSIEKVQLSLYRKLLPIIKNVELDPDGYILQNGKNRALLSDASRVIDEVLPSALQGPLSTYIGTINGVDAINQAYFESLSQGFLPNRTFIKSLQKSTISTIEKTLLQDGLQSQIKDPLLSVINRNINTGGSFDGFLREIRDFITGNENLDGRLKSYSRTLTRSALFDYSRAYQQSITSDLGLEFYLFSGPVITGGKGSEGSRGWCLERKGNYYHHKEIEAWASEDWAGKRQGTTENSIFTFVGGWNCVDSLIPVHESVVPKDVILRARQSGFIK